MFDWFVGRLLDSWQGSERTNVCGRGERGVSRERRKGGSEERDGEGMVRVWYGDGQRDRRTDGMNRENGHLG